MTFVDGFYRFIVELGDVDRNVYTQLKFKAAKHPHESLEYLYMRVLAYLHCYEPGVEFSRGLFEPKEPTFFMQDCINAVTLWAEVGAPSAKKVKRALSAHRDCSFKIYFLSDMQVDQWCQQLRGSKENWAAPIQFYRIDPASLAGDLVPLSTSSARWNITFVDNQFFLTAGEHEFTGEMERVDIWSRYQQMLKADTLAAG